MSETAAAAVERRRWGLGDVAAGLAASVLLSGLVGGSIALAAGWVPIGGVASATGQWVAQEQQGLELTPFIVSRVPVWGLAILQIPLWCGYLAVVVFAGRMKGNGVVADFGLSARPLDVPMGLVAGIMTQLLVLPLVYLPILSLTDSDASDLSRPARELSSNAGSPASWLLFAAIVGIGAPVVEELFFRGLFIRALQKRGFGAVAAVLISSAVFGAIHLQPLQFVGLALFGVVAGTFAVRTGRLGAAIWAHIGFNMTTVVVLYLGS